LIASFWRRKDLKPVTSTGGARSFKKEWTEEFQAIPEVYICFDNDEAGRKGALRVGRLITHSKIITLPGGVGQGGDVTDFFVRLARNREDFLKLLQEAKPAPPAPEIPRFVPKTRNGDSRERVERVKRLNPIVQVIGQYVQLRPSGVNLVGPLSISRGPDSLVHGLFGDRHFSLLRLREAR